MCMCLCMGSVSMVYGERNEKYKQWFPHISVYIHSHNLTFAHMPISTFTITIAFMFIFSHLHTALSLSMCLHDQEKKNRIIIIRRRMKKKSQSRNKMQEKESRPHALAHAILLIECLSYTIMSQACMFCSPIVFISCRLKHTNISVWLQMFIFVVCHLSFACSECVLGF